MTEIIQFGELARLQRLLDDKEREIEDLKHDLAEARVRLNALSGINDLLKLQLADLREMIAEWRAHLATVDHNLANLASKLPE